MREKETEKPINAGNEHDVGKNVQKPCLRCLLSEIPSAAALAASLRELIGLIPEEFRTPPEEVRRRLSVCRSCEHLNRGTCGLCGCFVEHRAEKKTAICPDTPSRWPKINHF